MIKVVVDTSVMVKWLNQIREQNLEQANRILAQALDGKVELIAPELAKYEIGNVLLFSKKLSTSEANFSLATLYSLPITFVSESEDLAMETFSLAHKAGITYYDASFLSLAKTFDATLVTENLKHQGRSKDIKVKPLSEY